MHSTVAVLVLVAVALGLAACDRGEPRPEEKVAEKTGAGGLPATSPAAPATGVYQFTVRRIDGTEESLAAYRGKVLLIVNVASRCGNTPQYAGLEALYKEHAGEGLVVLGFPANDFGHQEPGENAEIKTFCESRFGVTFPMFAKIHVKGPEIAPLYAYLTDKDSQGEFSGEVQWNFAKFLVGRDGKVVARFSPKTKPEDPALQKAVADALAKR